MARVNSEPYYYLKANVNGGNDRYVLAIRDSSKRSGYKQIIFHASRREAGIKAKELFDEYMEKNSPVEEKKEKPVTVASACRIFMKRRKTGRREINALLNVIANNTMNTLSALKKSLDSHNPPQYPEGSFVRFMEQNINSVS